MARLPWDAKAVDLPPGAMHLLEPQGNSTSFDFRSKKVERLTYSRAWKLQGSLTVDEILESYRDNQFGNENHRRTTPFVKALSGIVGEKIVERQIDGLIAKDTEFASLGGVWDFIIVGTGPHGVAAATTIRETRPQSTILMIEGGDKVGGQFRWYGPKPAFYMNSRVRRASRMVPGVPGTEGNINPMGSFAPLQLSDFVTGNYATNVEIGRVIQWNAYLSADMILTGSRAVFRDEPYNYDRREYLTELSVGNRYVRGRRVIDATGVRSGVQNQFTVDGVLSATDFYRHFANHPAPLEMFRDRKVMVIGGGDSAKTALEALIGNLPSETYGKSGVGRNRPREIVWAGAPGYSRYDIIENIRCRYQNGIPQAIGNLITIDARKVRGVTRNSMFYEVLMETEYLNPNIVIDCTSSDNGQDRVDRAAVELGRPERNGQLARVRENIGRPEAEVALWSTIPRTEETVASLVREMG